MVKLLCGLFYCPEIVRENEHGNFLQMTALSADKFWSLFPFFVFGGGQRATIGLLTKWIFDGPKGPWNLVRMGPNPKPARLTPNYELVKKWTNSSESVGGVAPRKIVSIGTGYASFRHWKNTERFVLNLIFISVVGKERGFISYTHTSPTGLETMSCNHLHRLVVKR